MNPAPLKNLFYFISGVVVFAMTTGGSGNNNEEVMLGKLSCNNVD